MRYNVINEGDLLPKYSRPSPLFHRLKKDPPRVMWYWWSVRDSNSWPPQCECGALSTELTPHVKLLYHEALKRAIKKSTLRTFRSLARRELARFPLWRQGKTTRVREVLFWLPNLNASRTALFYVPSASHISCVPSRVDPASSFQPSSVLVWGPEPLLRELSKSLA